MEVIMALVIMAVLIQAVVEGFKKDGLSHWDYAALALGAVLCPLAGIDAFSILGLPLKLPYLGAVLTGAIVGRGAAFVYDLWRILQEAPHKAPKPPTSPDNPA